MIVLLRADRKVQGLKRPCFPSEDIAENFDDAGIDRECAHIRVEGPRVLDAHAHRFRCHRPSGVEVEMGRKVLFYLLSTGVELRIGEPENGESVLVQVCGDPRGFGIEAACGHDFLENR